MPSPSNNKKKTVTSANSWRGKKPITAVVKLPSGNVCKVKRISIAKLLAEDLFPDEMTATVTAAVSEKQGHKPVAMPDTDDMSMKDMAKYIEAADKITAFIVVDPKVLLHVDSDGNEIDEDDRQLDTLYTDDVDLEDKLFLFQYAVGGGADVNTFRAEVGSSVGSVAPGEDVEDQTV